MKVQVQKWGNSLALRIPRSFAVETHIEEGSTVEMILEKNTIVLKPTKSEARLEDLLSGVTAENLHGEIEFGAPEGREAW